MFEIEEIMTAINITTVNLQFKNSFFILVKLQ